MHVETMSHSAFGGARSSAAAGLPGSAAIPVPHKAAINHTAAGTVLPVIVSPGREPDFSATSKAHGSSRSIRGRRPAQGESDRAERNGLRVLDGELAGDPIRFGSLLRNRIAEHGG